MLKKFFLSTASAFLVFNAGVLAQQTTPIKVGELNGSSNPITTAVPFLNITPDARGGAMGDVGVATSPDPNSTYWNAAKLAFIDKGYGVSISYNPWLRKLVNDMALSYVSGYMKIRKEEVIGLSLTYFDLGSIQFTNDKGDNLNKFSPNELAVAGTYSRKLSKNMSVAVSLKYIYSNLAGSIATSSGTEPASAGQTAAADVGYFYTKELSIKGTKNNLAFGANISNVGAKISYSNESQKDFIPSNLRVGSSFTHELDPYNKVIFSLDFNKLMVPTPPVYVKDANGNNTNVIAAGKAPGDGVLSGVLGSFSDAPGGFKEELREITISSGAEYWYNNLFAVRAGYFNESKFKGNRKYITAGFGLKYQVFTLDVAYLVPFEQNNPLAETLRFSLSFNFDKATESVKE